MTEFVDIQVESDAITQSLATNIANALPQFIPMSGLSVLGTDGDTYILTTTTSAPRAAISLDPSETYDFVCRGVGDPATITASKVVQSATIELQLSRASCSPGSQGCPPGGLPAPEALGTISITLRLWLSVSATLELVPALLDQPVSVLSDPPYSDPYYTLHGPAGAPPIQLFPPSLPSLNTQTVPALSYSDDSSVAIQVFSSGKKPSEAGFSFGYTTTGGAIYPATLPGGYLPILTGTSLVAEFLDGSQYSAIFRTDRAYPAGIYAPQNIQAPANKNEGPLQTSIVAIQFFALKPSIDFQHLGHLSSILETSLQAAAFITTTAIATAASAPSAVLQVQRNFGFIAATAGVTCSNAAPETVAIRITPRAVGEQAWMAGNTTPAEFVAMWSEFLAGGFANRLVADGQKLQWSVFQTAELLGNLVAQFVWAAFQDSDKASILETPEQLAPFWSPAAGPGASPAFTVGEFNVENTDGIHCEYQVLLNITISLIPATKTAAPQLQSVTTYSYSATWCKFIYDLLFTWGGLVVGGMIGGPYGAAIGAIVGATAGAIVTNAYKPSPPSPPPSCTLLGDTLTCTQSLPTNTILTAPGSSPALTPVLFVAQGPSSLTGEGDGAILGGNINPASLALKEVVGAPTVSSHVEEFAWYGASICSAALSEATATKDLAQYIVARAQIVFNVSSESSELDPFKIESVRLISADPSGVLVPKWRAFVVEYDADGSGYVQINIYDHSAYQEYAKGPYGFYIEVDTNASSLPKQVYYVSPVPGLSAKIRKQLIEGLEKGGNPLLCEEDSELPSNPLPGGVMGLQWLVDPAPDPESAEQWMEVEVPSLEAATVGVIAAGGVEIASTQGGSLARVSHLLDAAGDSVEVMFRDGGVGGSGSPVVDARRVRRRSERTGLVRTTELLRGARLWRHALFRDVATGMWGPAPAAAVASEEGIAIWDIADVSRPVLALQNADGMGRVVAFDGGFVSGGVAGVLLHSYGKSVWLCRKPAVDVAVSGSWLFVARDDCLDVFSLVARARVESRRGVTAIAVAGVPHALVAATRGGLQIFRVDGEGRLNPGMRVPVASIRRLQARLVGHAESTIAAETTEGRTFIVDVSDDVEVRMMACYARAPWFVAASAVRGRVAHLVRNRHGLHFSMTGRVREQEF